ncbi:hypothetical protein GC093_07315 [Paenibacillus sp. LMG 31456]|uniref:SLH domain-containing protein n=1 Tax=Paenibacillus foliorum TaxID=2654974 RepID=A0A972GLR8_9BACL|nr:S-layer homology domain-containing protein [Paenibacillus foliorum]NOU93042.1 hypothetical protein [Paenibacillus foliorum]
MHGSNCNNGLRGRQGCTGVANGAVAVVKKLSLVEGKGDNQFDPNAKTTKAAAVTVLLKMLAQKSG